MTYDTLGYYEEANGQLPVQSIKVGEGPAAEGISWNHRLTYSLSTQAAHYFSATAASKESGNRPSVRTGIAFRI